jgi:hypothetical protein
MPDEAIHYNSVRVIVIPTEIRTGYLQNTSRKRYRLNHFAASPSASPSDGQTLRWLDTETSSSGSVCYCSCDSLTFSAALSRARVTLLFSISAFQNISFCYVSLVLRPHILPLRQPLCCDAPTGLNRGRRYKLRASCMRFSRVLSAYRKWCVHLSASPPQGTVRRGTCRPVLSASLIATQMLQRRPYQELNSSFLARMFLFS